MTRPQARGPDLRSRVVARGGVEPPTFRFSVGRSYQLSYLAKPRKPYRRGAMAKNSASALPFGPDPPRALCWCGSRARRLVRSRGQAPIV